MSDGNCHDMMQVWLLISVWCALGTTIYQSSDSCVDDSGRWGRGGLFTALEVRSDEPRKQYELAGKMKGKIDSKKAFYFFFGGLTEK